MFNIKYFYNIIIFFNNIFNIFMILYIILVETWLQIQIILNNIFRIKKNLI